MLYYALLIPLFSFALQVWPRLKNRYFGIDTWRHLLLADYVRKNHKIPTVLKKQYIHSSGNPGYPPVIYLILSIFPKNFAEKYQFIFAPIFDAIQNYVIFWFAFLITQDVFTSICAQIVAALTPIAVIEASNLSTRTLSYLVFSLSFIPLVIFSSTHLFVWLIAAFIMLIILFLTHKFAVQAYFFTTLGLSIVERDPLYILVFIAGFIFVYFFIGRIYRPIFREHMLILTFWIKNISNRFIHQFRGQPKSKEVKDFVHKLYLLSFKSPYIYMLGNNPWIGVFIVLMILPLLQNLQMESTIMDQNMLIMLDIWVWVAIVVGMITLSIKPLRFLGEGNRYLEYCIVPISIVLASYIPSLINTYGLLFITSSLFVVVILFLYIIFLQIKVVLRDRMRTITPEMWECIKCLNKFGSKARVAIFPLQFGDALTYFIKGKVLTTYNNEGLANIIDVYPVVRIPLNDLIKKFNINFILFEENHVTLKELKLSKYKIEVNKNGYILLRV